MSGILLPDPIQQWFGSAGLPLAFGKVLTYAAGTSTFIPAYSDYALLVPYGPTIALDAQGKAVIYLGASVYKIDVQDQFGVSIDGYPRDNVPGVSSSSGGGTGLNDNILIGNGAGANITSGGQNTLIGAFAGRLISTQNDNTFIGNRAGLNNVASDNVFIGSTTGQSNTTGNFNTFVGRCGNNNTTGVNNTFVGYVAGNLNTTGADNTFVGVNSGTTNVQGFGNTYLGSGAGLLNTSGNGNTAIGNAAGAGGTTATFNTYVGKFSGQIETGSANAYYGYKSGFVSTSGDRNTYLGNSAAITATTGDDNTLVGYDAGHGLTTGSGNLVLGANSVISAAATGVIVIGQGLTNINDNTAILGGTSLTDFRIGGSGTTFNLGSGGVNVFAMGGANGAGFNASGTATADATDIGRLDFGTTGTAGVEKRVAAIHAFLKGSNVATATGNLVFYTTNAGTIAESFRCNELGTVVGQAGTAARAPLNIPHGAAPSAPVNGDIWTTTAGIFVRINGATVGPLS